MSGEKKQLLSIPYQFTLYLVCLISNVKLIPPIRVQIFFSVIAPFYFPQIGSATRFWDVTGMYGIKLTYLDNDVPTKIVKNKERNTVM